MSIITRLLAWWNRADVLAAEVEKLRRERQIAVDALKKIATSKEGGYYVPQDVAHDCLTKDLGLRAFHVSENCSPNEVWLVPRGWAGTPTHYL